MLNATTPLCEGEGSWISTAYYSQVSLKICSLDPKPPSSQHYLYFQAPACLRSIVSFVEMTMLALKTRHVSLMRGEGVVLLLDVVLVVFVLSARSPLQFTMSFMAYFPLLQLCSSEWWYLNLKSASSRLTHIHQKIQSNHNPSHPPHIISSVSKCPEAVRDATSTIAPNVVVAIVDGSIIPSVIALHTLRCVPCMTCLTRHTSLVPCVTVKERPPRELWKPTRLVTAPLTTANTKKVEARRGSKQFPLWSFLIETELPSSYWSSLTRLLTKHHTGTRADAVPPQKLGCHGCNGCLGTSSLTIFPTSLKDPWEMSTMPSHPLSFSWLVCFCCSFWGPHRSDSAFCLVRWSYFRLSSVSRSLFEGVDGFRVGFTRGVWRKWSPQKTNEHSWSSVMLRYLWLSNHLDTALSKPTTGVFVRALSSLLEAMILTQVRCWHRRAMERLTPEGEPDTSSRGDPLPQSKACSEWERRMEAVTGVRGPDRFFISFPDLCQTSWCQWEAQVWRGKHKYGCITLAKTWRCKWSAKIAHCVWSEKLAARRGDPVLELRDFHEEKDGAMDARSPGHSSNSSLELVRQALFSVWTNSIRVFCTHQELVELGYFVLIHQVRHSLSRCNLLVKCLNLEWLPPCIAFLILSFFVVFRMVNRRHLSHISCHALA